MWLGFRRRFFNLNDRLKILNVWVDAVDMERAISRVKQFLEKGNRPHSILAVNPEKNFSVPKDPILNETFRTADLLIPDGIGVVIAARILYNIKLSRVPGVELMEKICELAAKDNYGIFLYGAREEVNASAAKALAERHKGLKVAGRSNGYIKEQEMNELVSKINVSKANILFLALGSPKQERWFAAHKDALENIRVCQGIGGTLDTIAGNVKRAPEIWQKYNAEWLYRLIKEPGRISRQKMLPLFGAMVLITKLKAYFKFSRDQ